MHFVIKPFYSPFFSHAFSYAGTIFEWCTHRIAQFLNHESGQLTSRLFRHKSELQWRTGELLWLRYMSRVKIQTHLNRILAHARNVNEYILW